MNNNIALLLNFYQCHDELKRLLDSIPQGLFKYVIAVDGVYKFHHEKYPDLPMLSDDGSQQLIFEHAHDLKKFAAIISYLPNSLEFEKRNEYLKICEKHEDDIDVGIIWDSDEFMIYPDGGPVEKAINIFKQNLERIIRKHKDHNVFSIMSHNLNADHPYDAYHPRIWVNPGQMRYQQGSHYYYANVVREQKQIEEFKKQRYNYVQYSAGIVKGIALAHSHALRSKEYMKQREDYIEYIKRFEGLTQSHYFSLDESHKLAMLGINRDQVNISNKEEIIQKYL